MRQVQCREGHSGENSISGKTGIHFKISAQKGVAGLFSSQEGRWVPDPYRVPPSPTLKQVSAQNLLGEAPLLRQGERVSEHSPVLSRPRASSEVGHRSLHTTSELPGYHMKDGGGERD